MYITYQAIYTSHMGFFPCSMPNANSNKCFWTIAKCLTYVITISHWRSLSQRVILINFNFEWTTDGSMGTVHCSVSINSCQWFHLYGIMWKLNVEGEKLQFNGNHKILNMILILINRDCLCVAWHCKCKDFTHNVLG